MERRESRERKESQVVDIMTLDSAVYRAHKDSQAVQACRAQKEIPSSDLLGPKGHLVHLG